MVSVPWRNRRVFHIILLPRIMENGMADNKTERGAADRERVNVHEDYELRYWSDKIRMLR